MKQFSETIGFSYMPHVEDDEAFLQRFSRLSLFTRGRTRNKTYEVTVEFRPFFHKIDWRVSTQTVVIIEDLLNLSHSSPQNIN